MHRFPHSHEMPHEPTYKKLGVIISPEIVKTDRCTVELEFAKERPFWRQPHPGARKEIQSRTDVEVRRSATQSGAFRGILTPPNIDTIRSDPKSLAKFVNETVHGILKGD